MYPRPSILSQFPYQIRMERNHYHIGQKAYQKSTTKAQAYVEEITFKDCRFKEHSPKEYESLQELKSITYGKGCSKLTHPINQIKAYSSIITSFHLGERIWASREPWKSLLECTNLYHLEVYRKYIRAFVDLFFQVCKKACADNKEDNNCLLTYIFFTIGIPVCLLSTIMQCCAWKIGP
ncbi:hypothetical protein BCR41DRAFT_366553 [Lobosporangium transversale]|uniref:Uncharacterized protein n=1 Tax=Lobosporangium transversale TaxID=64571 RepID=A0A1Y2H2N5_9FUNG|nr:hypothetical protein BCR41DRAFT_366553 [Lobosporangium transversale]ORZ28839.1 hypothetical protein BCR41DRAFT_366553 [Lobosporangium transversale]|eukprot:XP_021886512.1 hypothetical protein BCR41DRAFT_366553 [Lobosporangium transversale]